MGFNVKKILCRGGDDSEKGRCDRRAANLTRGNLSNGKLMSEHQFLEVELSHSSFC